VLIYSAAIRLEESLADPWVRDWYRAWVMPNAMPLWQYAAVLNALITIAYYFIAEKLLIRLDNGQPVPEGLLFYFPRIVFILSGTLTTYTILVQLWIITHHPRFIHFPPIGPIWPAT
jgi:hypothetical protein